MKTWLTTFYSNQAIIDHKHLKWRWSIPLYLLLMLVLSAPSAISLYRFDVKTAIPLFNNFARDYALLVGEADCTIDPTLVCDPTKATYAYETYTFKMGQTDTPREPLTVYFGDEIVEITDTSGTLVAGGTYLYLEGYSFETQRDALSSGQITKPDLSEAFLRAIILSSFSAYALVRFLALLANFTFFVLAIAYVFRFVSLKKPRLINFKQGFAVVVQLMTVPTLLSALAGLFIPDQTLLLFLSLFLLRFVWMYQQIITKRLSLLEHKK
jgi:hypothetical protein